MRVIGIDPGIAITGIGVLDELPDGSLCCYEYSVIRTSAGLEDPARLHSVFLKIQEVIKLVKPQEAAVERLFFQKNVKTAMQVGQARGVVILALEMAGIPIREYTPMEVKQAITGYGKAEKVQVQTMVKALLNLESIPKPDDAADALAIAICHINSRRSGVDENDN